MSNAPAADSAAPARGRNATLFREEALRHHLLRREFGDVLRLPPAWTRWTYPWIVAMALATLALLGFVRVPRYVQGRATVRLAPDGTGWLDVHLPAARVARVTAGDRLHVRFPAFPRRSAQAEVVAVAPRPSLDMTLDARLPQPAVALQARLLPDTNAALPLVAGLPAEVELLVGRERGLFVLLPGLRR